MLATDRGSAPSIAVGSSLQAADVTFKVVSLIGEGSGGTSVYLASIVTNSACIGLPCAALKCIPFTNALQEKRIGREASLLKTIMHQNVVRMVSAAFNHVSIGFSHVVIPLEYCSGGSLRQRLLQSGPQMELREALQILRQILCGVCELHHKSVIHRDLKPENVLLRGDGTVCIADLGIASEGAVTQSRRTAQAGTMPYLAPEQFGSVYGPKVDLWAVGVIILDVALGLRWNDGNPVLALQPELCWQVVAQRIPPPLGPLQSLAAKLLRASSARLDADAALAELSNADSTVQRNPGNDPFRNIEKQIVVDKSIQVHSADPFARVS